MDASKLIEFLGHTSIHPPLDDFLIQNEIKKRPESYETKDVILKKIDLSLCFVDNIEFKDDYLVLQKSEGVWIFTEIVLESKFMGLLPFNLNIKMNYAELTAVLGNQLKIAVSEIPKETQKSPSFFYNGVFIAAKFNTALDKLEFIRFGLPNKYDKLHHNLQVN